MLAGRVAARSLRVAAPRVAFAARRGYAEESKPSQGRQQQQQSSSSGGSSGGASQNVSPPVEVYGLDGTYASALYVAASKQGSLNDISKALDNLHKNFKSDPNLETILTAPTLSTSDKKQIATELQKNAGVQDKGNTLKNFLDTLAENNRLGVLAGVCEKFAVLMSAARGEVEMTITSAAPLDQKVVRQLEQAVSKSHFIGQGKKLKVTPKVDSTIRGGLIVEIGDQTIDLSVASKMAKMNNLLLQSM